MKIGGEIVQKPENTAPVIPVAALDAEPDSVFFQQLVKLFDLLSDTLYRAGIWYRENRTWLFLDIHHIICDGLSSAVLLNDLASVLKGGGTTQEAVTAYDYALYEKEQLADIETRLGEAHFEDMIRQAEPVVWPDSETTDGNARGIAEYTVARETIDAFCAAQAVTPGSFLQAAFALTLLKKRVAATPDAPAFIFHDKTLTYRELDDITSRLAVFLRKSCGIGPEDNVGVLIHRSELMAVYPFAVIKTGAGYTPLDPQFPTDRLSFMCEDANVRLILSGDRLLE